MGQKPTLTKDLVSEDKKAGEINKHINKRC